MITDRYYYSRLTEKEKRIYVRLYQGVVALEKNILIPEHVEHESVRKIYQAITDDNPYLYYFNQSVLNTAISDQAIILKPQYFCTAEQIDILVSDHQLSQEQKQFFTAKGISVY